MSVMVTRSKVAPRLWRMLRIRSWVRGRGGLYVLKFKRDRSRLRNIYPDGNELLVADSLKDDDRRVGRRVKKHSLDLRFDGLFLGSIQRSTNRKD